MKKILIAFLMINLPLMASELKSEKSQKIAQQLVRSINQKLTEIAELEVAAGVKPENIAVDLSQHQRFDSGRFGAILDVKTPGKVLSVTPKSPAYQLGLQSGDVILSVNNSPITQTDANWRDQLQYLTDNSPVQLKVLRSKKELLLKDTLPAKFTPQWQLTSSADLLLESDINSLQSLQQVEDKLSDINSQETLSSSCGKVVTGRFIKYKTGKVTVTAIDGKNVDTRQKRFKLSIGDHVLTIKNMSTMTSLRAISGDFKKTKFHINVKENELYYLGYVKDTVVKGSNATGMTYSGAAILKVARQNCENPTYKNNMKLPSIAKVQAQSQAKSGMLICENEQPIGTRIIHKACRLQGTSDSLKNRNKLSSATVNRNPASICAPRC